jgi:hypothetical protein
MQFRAVWNDFEVTSGLATTQPKHTQNEHSALVRSSAEMPTDREKPANDAHHNVQPETLGVTPAGHNPAEALQSLSTKHLHASENEQDDPD